MLLGGGRLHHRGASLGVRGGGASGGASAPTPVSPAASTPVATGIVGCSGGGPLYRAQPPARYVHPSPPRSSLLAEGPGAPTAREGDRRLAHRSRAGSGGRRAAADVRQDIPWHAGEGGRDAAEAPRGAAMAAFQASHALRALVHGDDNPALDALASYAFGASPREAVSAALARSTGRGSRRRSRCPRFPCHFSLPPPRVCDTEVAGGPAIAAMPVVPEHGAGTAPLATCQDGIPTVIEGEVSFGPLPEVANPVGGGEVGMRRGVSSPLRVDWYRGW